MTALPLPGLNALWRYRSFIRSSIATEFRLRVSRSRLGILWLVISPLIQVAMYSLVLSTLMRSRLPGIDNTYAYTIYLLAGFLAWFPFVEIINRAVTLFIDNGNALKKIAFPRMILPVVAVAVAAISNAIMVVVVLAAYLLMGHVPGANLLWLPLLFLVNMAFATGLGLCLGVLNVFIRDVGQLVAIALQFGFWLTPIVYVIDIIPASYRWLIALNPMFWIIDGYHRVLAFDQPPQLKLLLAASILAFLLLLLARFLLRRSQSEMMDVL